MLNSAFKIRRRKPQLCVSWLFFCIFRALALSTGFTEVSARFHTVNVFARGGSYSGDKNLEQTISGSKIHEIVEEKVLYKRWRTLISRLIRFPDGKMIDFEIVGQSGSDRAVLIFAWDTKTKTATLVREYMPGANAIKYGIAAGLVEDKHNMAGKEDQTLIAARHELEEECHLVGGTWFQLTDDTIMDKYATTVVNVFLVVDPEHAVDPKPLDEEEDIEIFPNISISEILQLIASGEMNVVGGWASLLAIRKLQEMNLAN